jgi:hypothetical protein
VVAELNGGGVVEWECLKSDLSLSSNVFEPGKGREWAKFDYRDRVSRELNSWLHSWLAVLKE